MIQAETHQAEDAIPQSMQESSTVDILITLARRKRFIGLFTLIATLVAVVISLVLPVEYTAFTILLPPSQSSSASSMLMSELGGGLGSLASLAGGSLGIKDPNDMYAALFRTRTVEDAMIHRFGLMKEYHVKRMSDARKKLEDHSTVILGVKDGLLRISVEDHNAKRAADLANGYVDAFRDNSMHLAISEAARRRAFFGQQLIAAKDKLANAEVALEQTEQSTGMLQPGGQTIALIQSAADLRAQITAKQVEIESLRSFATDNNPDLLRAQQELAALQKQSALLQGSGRAGEPNLLLSKGKIPKAGLEYVRKLRDVKYNETVYDLLAKQFEAAKLDEAREGPMIQVVDVAVPPDKKSFPRRAILVALAVILSFLLSIFWVLIADRWKRSLRSPESGEKLGVLLKLLSLKR